MAQTFGPLGGSILPNRVDVLMMFYVFPFTVGQFVSCLFGVSFPRLFPIGIMAVSGGGSVGPGGLLVRHSRTWGGLGDPLVGHSGCMLGLRTDLPGLQGRFVGVENCLFLKYFT